MNWKTNMTWFKKNRGYSQNATQTRATFVIASFEKALEAIAETQKRIDAMHAQIEKLTLDQQETLHLIHNLNLKFNALYEQLDTQTETIKKLELQITQLTPRPPSHSPYDASVDRANRKNKKKAY